MKNKIKASLVLLSFMLLLFPIYSFAETGITTNVTFKYVKEDQKVLENIPEIGCKAVYIAEPNTGTVIYEKNAYEKMFPASTTKILTALVVLERCDLSEVTTVSKHAIELIPEGYSNASLKVGEELDIKTLLQALLIPSANEAGNVLAEHVSGSIEEFVELCNKRAKELGCETLHFTNTNGIHDENHYCSAYDLYLIAKECRKFDVFNEIVSSQTFTLPATNVYSKADRTFKSTNELLHQGKYYYAYCNGIKTGHTTPAGECFVGSSSYNNLDFISVVLGGKTSNSKGFNERFYDTKQLFEYSYNNYAIKDITEQGELGAKLKIGKATKETAFVGAIVDTTISTIVPNYLNKENIISSIAINENIVAPIKKDEVLGTITYNADGLVYTTNLIASHSVDKLPYEVYNSIVVGVLFLTFILFIVLFKKCKRKIIAIIMILLIATAEGFAIYYIVQEGMANSITKII